MKKLTLVFAFMLAVAGAAAQSMYVHKTDGNVYEFKVSDVDSINFAASTTDDYLYTITYMPNGGEGEVVVDTVFYGESYSIRGFRVYTKEGYYIGSWNTNPDGHGTHFYLGRTINAVTRNITLYAQWRAANGTENGHEWVELGLPSGTKWAACNVGATTPTGYGNYYAWGETEPKTTYDWKTYKWATATQNEWGEWNLETLTKYNTDSGLGTIDNKTVLDPEDDAAAVNWGGAWRMPTDEECQELIDNCTWTWTDDYNGTGVAGQIVTSNITGNSIFLPAAGYRDDMWGDDGLKGAGNSGGYFSSSLNLDLEPYEYDSGYAWVVDFRSDYVNRNRIDRFFGQSVRPILK